MKDDCIFCKIVAGQIPAAKIYEDHSVFAFLDIGPLSPGHTLVIPKQHYKSLHDCPPDLVAQLAAKLGKIAQAVITAMGYEAYNVLCNTGRAAGQLVDHVHFHIIGRRANDGVFTSWPAKQYQQGEIERIAKKITENL